MAMSVTYATVHGRLVEENRGGVVTEYVPDTLGNVIMTTDESGTVTSTTTYWPFGEVRTQTGTNPSPWGFCGVWGYLTDAVSRMYVRARHYRADTSRWLTVDPLWPLESAYGYANESPLQYVDYYGTHPCDLRTADYCRIAGASGGNMGMECICKVSGIICEVIKNPAVPHCIRAWLDCINRGMYNCYKRHNGPLWDFADRVCRQLGSNTCDCCNAMIGAEQTCFSEQRPYCDTVGCPPSRWPHPWDKLTKLPPFDFMNMLEPDRIATGRRLCCGTIRIGLLP